MRKLRAILEGLDGRGYKAYKQLERSTFHHPAFRLLIDHVQGDPYAAPSRMRAFVERSAAELPASAVADEPRTRATRDFLARAFARAARNERDVTIDAGGQTVLDRSACRITEDIVELRFRVDLPASGRRILGRRAAALLCDAVPAIVECAAMGERLDLDELERHCAAVADQVALRSALSEAGLTAFVANGSRLPRRSGIDDRPLDSAIEFVSPCSLEVTLQTPNSGPVTGMGLPRGIALIVGGGFHGKSTLLRALQTGVWDHVPDDGRERVVIDPRAVKLRAEDGRSVSAVDISPFIDHLPGGTSTDAFTTDLASGSTSQAAALVEALEAGATTILLDEDTSATNFMIRDRRMQALVAKAREPITPFVDRIGELRDRLSVSTVLVMGGSGDYFEHADTVIQMDAFRPRDVSRAAHDVAASHPTGRMVERETELRLPVPRTLDTGNLSPEAKPGRPRVRARGRDTLVFGRTEIDLRAVEQIEDPSQVRAIGWILARVASRDQRLTESIPAIEKLLDCLRNGDWDLLNGRPDGDLALPRLHEVMAALNRLRGARFEADTRIRT
jgi:predicted ABC-class ATPase